MNTNTKLSKGSRIQLNERQAARTGMLLLLLLLALPAMAQPEAVLTYTTNNGAITITGIIDIYWGKLVTVDIPSTIHGLPVTSIGDWAFSMISLQTGQNSYLLRRVTIPGSITNIGGQAFLNSPYLTSVTLGNGLASIGTCAFAICPGLTDVAIPESVVAIGSGAFSSCTNLTGITIPENVTSLGEGAFAGCASLGAIEVYALNAAYSSVDGVLFDKSQTSLIQYPGGKAGSYSVPNGVTEIETQAFSGCAGLTSVLIPNSVTNLGSAAFESCVGLTGISIPNSVTSIGDGAFASCGKLTAVPIPDSVTSIGADAFVWCTSLTNVTIPDNVTSMGFRAFAGCSNLTTVTTGRGVTGVGDQTFQFCTSLTTITLGNSVTSIGGDAFQFCTSLTNVAIPNRVTNIGGGAFQGCGNLAKVTIGSGVIHIWDWAFQGCTNLTAAYFQGNAPAVAPTAFRGDNLTVYYLPGTTGWGPTFAGQPTALWTEVPTILSPPGSQTAEAGSAVSLRVEASSPLPLSYLWYFNNTNLISSSTNGGLALTGLQFSQSGAYTVVVSNALGAVTSAPALLQVIARVERRPVPGVKVMGQAGNLLNVDYADSLSLAPNWTSLGSVSLTGTSGYCCDPILPLPPQRFYRTWQTGAPGVRPSLDLHLVPAITLTSSIGHSVRLDYINQFGPIDAWVTLATVALSSESQLYFDISAPGQPPRLYRLVPSP